MAQRQMIRTSERGAFKRCPQRWWWSWVEGLRPRDASKALWFGEGWHLVMADYYRKGTRRSKDYIDMWRDWCNTSDSDGMYQACDDMGQEWVDMRDLGEIMLTNYVKHYEGDKSWDVIETEYSGEVRIPSNDRSRTIQYNFTFDGVYRDKQDGKIKLMEHKTAKDLSINHLSLDDQAGSYWAVAPTILRDSGVLGPKDQIRSITYNIVRKAKPDKRPRDEQGYALNKNGSRSMNQPRPLFLRHEVRRTPRERRTQIDRIKNEADSMSAMQSGDLPIFKNPTRDCSWDCGFFNMCELHDARADWEQFRDAIYIKTDPYASHRKKAS